MIEKSFPSLVDHASFRIRGPGISAFVNSGGIASFLCCCRSIRIQNRNFHSDWHRSTCSGSCSIHCHRITTRLRNASGQCSGKAKTHSTWDGSWIPELSECTLLRQYWWHKLNIHGICN